MHKPFDFWNFVSWIVGLSVLTVPVWFLFGMTGVWAYVGGVLALFGALCIGVLCRA